MTVATALSRRAQLSETARGNRQQMIDNAAAGDGGCHLCFALGCAFGLPWTGIRVLLLVAPSRSRSFRESGGFRERLGVATGGNDYP
ncbi:MAG: hypothetical protein WCN95_06345 [bacterium]